MLNPIPSGPKRSGVYQIVNRVNHKVYVGSSHEISYRWKQHRKALVSGTHHCRHLQHAWNLYGADTFEFEVVEHCTEEQLLSREQVWLDAAVAQGIAYNVCPVATSPLGVVRSDEFKEKCTTLCWGTNDPRARCAPLKPEP